MTLKAKLWCLSNDCSYLSVVFIETKSLRTMRNATTSPYKQFFYLPSSRITSGLKHISFSRNPSSRFLRHCWIAFPRDAQSHSPHGTGALIGFVLLKNHILLALKNLCCPLKILLNVPQAACLPQCQLYLPPLITVSPYIYPAMQMPALLCLRTLLRTQSVSCIISWGWTPISYDVLKTAYLGKVTCNFS